jgi:hypothetical protein
MRIFAIKRGGVVLLGGPAPFEGIWQSKTWNTRPLCVFGTILLVGKNLPVESKKFGKPSEIRSNRTRFVAIQPMNRPEAAGVDACPVAPSAFDCTRPLPFVLASMLDASAANVVRSRAMLKVPPLAVKGISLTMPWRFS